MPAVPGVLALDPAAHVVDGGEGEPHDVEGVQYPRGLRQRGCIAGDVRSSVYKISDH